MYKECYEVETLHLNDTNAKKKGLARLMYLKCNSGTKNVTEVETLHLNDTNAKKKGPARLMYLKCHSCTKNVTEVYTSKNVMILSKKGEESLWRSTLVQ